MRKDLMDILACPVCKGPLSLWTRAPAHERPGEVSRKKTTMLWKEN